MGDDRWQRIEDIFHRSVAMPPEGRPAFLDEACGADPSLRKEVESLMVHCAADGNTFVGASFPQATPDTIAHYRITSKLGEGGMGAVYRATDTKLGRDVAIKVLPAAFAADPDRMARFNREAKLLASLNHPNIAAIHGVEERALILELVEGDAPRGPLPVEQALPLARQLAEALEYAHEKGIIHRDLKPANIKITPEGQVKVLDFGLTKAMSDDPSSIRPDDSPTLTGTKAGVILGTAAYMSPEQAMGKPVDRRADIWAFGIVLLEMLTGRRVYEGATGPETLALVLTKDPALDSLPSGVPPFLRALLRRCLERDPRRRLQAIGEARIALSSQDAPAEVSAPVRNGHERVAWIAAALLALSTGFALWAPWRTAPKPEPTRRWTIDLGANVSLADWSGDALAFSPDGTLLAYVNGSGKTLLYLRRLDQLTAAPLVGTDGASSPFFSPDSQWIAFFADGKLKKVSLRGGDVVNLCDTPLSTAAWGADGNILISANQQSGGFMRISEAGGTPQAITTTENAGVDQRWPQLLPGDKAILFTATTADVDIEDSRIEVQVLATGQRKTVQQAGYHGRYLPSGHLVYMHQGTLFAAGFDLNRMETTTAPVPALRQYPATSLRVEFSSPSPRKEPWLICQARSVTNSRSHG